MFVGFGYAQRPANWAQPKGVSATLNNPKNYLFTKICKLLLLPLSD